MNTRVHVTCSIEAVHIPFTLNNKLQPNYIGESHSVPYVHPIPSHHDVNREQYIARVNDQPILHVSRV